MYITPLTSNPLRRKHDDDLISALTMHIDANKNCTFVHSPQQAISGDSGDQSTSVLVLDRRNNITEPRAFIMWILNGILGLKS